MRILLLTSSNSVGGAAIACGRLMKALQSQNIDVCLLSGESLGNKTSKRFRFVWERISIFIRNGLSRKNLFKVSIANTGYDVTALDCFQDADIIHLHWIQHGFISMNILDKILHCGKPVVWTLHDMWPFTGICHYAFSCRNYCSGCGSCIYLKSNCRRDVSAKIFDRKLSEYSGADLHFVSVSNWLARKAAESPLLTGSQLSVIPNTISLQEFRLIEKTQAQLSLNLSESKQYIVFGASYIDNYQKGFDLLVSALDLLSAKADNICLLLFGSVKDISLLDKIPVDYIYYGAIDDNEKLSLIYSAANVTVSSSYYETFGQTLIESLACGCIPVSFGNSGQTDIIRHKENGYLAEYLSCESLAAGISWALEQKPDKTKLREDVLSRFGYEVVAKQYIDIYNKCLNKK